MSNNITVKILADSVNPAGNRITSWLLKYPRFIHAEFMTHRVFSRNAASSRAIPLAKMINEVTLRPALPEYWGTTQKGMQSGCEANEMGKRDAENCWMDARENAMNSAEELAGLDIHKSICNRLIEPFSHITVLATATDHSNFFALRAHPDAMPEFQVLAYRMLAQYIAHEPTAMQWGDWHIPYFCHAGDDQLLMELKDTDERILKIATARCARLSYLTFDGDHSADKDIELHDRLLSSGHMSPFEHCAQAMQGDGYRWSNFDNPHDDDRSMGFDGISIGGLSHWQQYRKQFDNENRTNVDLAAVMATKPEWIKL